MGLLAVGSRSHGSQRALWARSEDWGLAFSPGVAVGARGPARRGVLALAGLLSTPNLSGRRCRERDVIARRRARPQRVLTSQRAELRCNAAASPGRGAGLASVRRLPGEAGDWGRDRMTKVAGSRSRLSLSPTVHRA